jgi:hypothetical protein
LIARENYFEKFAIGEKKSLIVRAKSLCWKVLFNEAARGRAGRDPNKERNCMRER